jgi:signal transduction histidine kinase
VRAVHLRLVLVLDAVALGAAGAAIVLGAGLPLAARGALTPARVVAVAVGVAVATAVAGAALLVRQVGRPVDRVLAAAEALGAGDLPLLGAPDDAGGRGLSGAAVAFERLASALASERARLAQKLAELERANEELVRARATLVRAERLATAGRLASGVAHEVGNPLGAITGYAELARERVAALEERAGAPGRREASAASQGSPRQELDDFLRRIVDEAQRIDRIVRGLLDLARPAVPVLGDVDVAVPIDAALRLARIQPRFRGVEVEVDVSPALPRVSADEARLAQVFLNLLLNAADAMSGAGRVRVTARERAGRVEVEVRDSGPGIPASDLPRVFEPFFSTKPTGEGTGLGLAISQGIVESLGGELAAANAEGGGAVLTVALRPAGPGAGPAAAAC